MNTNPDNQTLLLWLEDELASDLQKPIDQWAAGQPEWLAKREAAREWRSQMSRVMAISNELPQGDFFQAQIFRSIATKGRVTSSPAVARDNSPMKKWWMPLSVAAAMVFGFLGGMQWREKPNRATTLVTYTPAEGVRAEFFESSPSEGTVIVLNGMEALPDSFVNTEITSAEPVHSSDSHLSEDESEILVAP
jgi:hypothetical protein